LIFHRANKEEFVKEKQIKIRLKSFSRWQRKEKAGKKIVLKLEIIMVDNLKTIQICRSTNLKPTT
jgi:hypothetical protein